ncbi:hypothetical protein TTRE_0000716201 [Trichuris trichiura]|uniref:Uncharacterized protein n=1 Tax=Trichuris trichiura TaxID=36087 RepID=A0A077ZEQ9_TRITR|nr:hypothetical protein TTRE_0000716201 [Trichuris trichiura]
MVLKGLTSCASAAANRAVGVVSKTCFDIVQWRSSVASAIYVLFVNSIYWFFVLYSERIRQMEVLSALLSLFGIDVIVVPLVRIALLVRRQIKYADRSEKEFAGTQQSNLLNSTLVLLFRAIALFVYNFCFHLLCHKKAKIIFFVLCFVTIKSLVENDLYLCCRTGYSMLVLWLILPPWQYHKVNRRIYNATLQVWNLCFAYVSSCVVKPILHGLAAIHEFIKFLVLFKWLFPLINKLYVTFICPVTNYIKKTAKIFVYLTLGVARQGYMLSSRLVNEISLLCGPPYQQAMATLLELNNELTNEDEEELSEYLPSEEMVDDSFKAEERKPRVKDSELAQLPNINEVDSSSDSNESEEFLPGEPIDDVASSSSSTDRELEDASKDMPFDEQTEQENSGLSDVNETSVDLAKRETLWNSIRSACAAGRSRLKRFSTSSGVRRRKQAPALSDEEQEIADFEPSVEEFELLDNELDDDKSKRNKLLSVVNYTPVLTVSSIVVSINPLSKSRKCGCRALLLF